MSSADQAQARIVLVFAYHYPPETLIGAARPARLVKYLNRIGYRCHVFTAAEQPAPVPDVHFVPDPHISAVRKGVGFQVERAIRKFLLPGVTGCLWSTHACRAAEAVIRSNPRAQATILSTFPPLGTHLAAWQLHRRAQVPWIADFRDPMTSPGLSDLIQPFQYRLTEWLEAKVLRKASLVLANTSTAAEAWRALYPDRGNQIHLLWNGFDPEKRIPPLPLPAREFRILSHVGELYHGRTVVPLLESVDRLVQNAKLDPRRIRVSIIGPASTDSIPSDQFIQRAKDRGWLDLSTTAVSRQTALELTQTSDFLLLAQPQSAVQVPGKLFEYIQIGRPILAFLKEGSPIEPILKQSGVPYGCIYAGSSEQRFDQQMLEFLSLPAGDSAPSQWFEDQFSADRQVEVLHKLIRSLHT